MADRRDPTGEVLEAMRAAGCEPADSGAIAFDGRLHRYDVVDDRRGRKNGWFVLFDGPIPAGAFGSWKTEVTQTWRATAPVELTPEQRRWERARIEAAQAERLAERRRLQARARARAAALWERARPGVDARHPYLVKKQVPAIGLRQLGNLLVAPVRDGDGALLSLEFLNPEGGKTFLKEGAVEGGHHWLGDPAGARAILVCEGYATGASLHEACGWPVAVAFGAGNLFDVAKDLQRRYPDAARVIAGDDDRHTPGNPGRRHAEETARRVNGAAIRPDFAGLDTASRPTDFNDLRVLGGLAHLRRQLETRLAAVLPAAAMAAPASGQPADPGARADDARPVPAMSVPAMAVPAAMGAPGRHRTAPRGAGGRPNLYQEVTDRIVAMIEAGTAPWQRPWDRARHPGAPAFPINAATGKTYRGVNVLLLGADPRTADDPRWCGYGQARARGWQVRAGARGATIYFFKRLEIPEAGEADAEPPPDEDGRPLGRTVPLLRRQDLFIRSAICEAGRRGSCATICLLRIILQESEFLGWSWPALRTRPAGTPCSTPPRSRASRRWRRCMGQRTPCRITAGTWRIGWRTSCTERAPGSSTAATGPTTTRQRTASRCRRASGFRAPPPSSAWPFTSWATGPATRPA